MDRPHTVAAGAEAALAAIVAGDVERGFEQYDASLKGDYLPHVPVGLHAGMLEQAGRIDDAVRLKAIAVRNGADLALRAGSFLGADPAVAAAEYEELFAKGLINSRMIYEYLKALARLGRYEEHARLLAPGELFYTTTLNRAAPAPFKGTLAAAVETLVLELEDQAERQEAVQSVRKMSMTNGFANRDHPIARAIMTEIAKETAEYLARWRRSDHPLARFVPEQWCINAWSLISRGDGYNIPHIHGYGWLSGVFYPRPPTCAGGEFVVGAPESVAASNVHWGERQIRPESGLLILMPSYYTHWTMPLEEPGLRISLAFDVIRAQNAT